MINWKVSMPMKKILITINTLGLAGAETALLGLLKQLENRDLEVSLFVLTGQGELLKRIPSFVKVLNQEYHETSVLSKEGRKILRKSVLRALIGKGRLFTLFPYLCKNAVMQMKEGKIRADKLLWRVLSDAANVFEEEYDLAIAYLEGGSTYYVADHVKARKKVTFLHVDYTQAGYNRSLDLDCYLRYDKIFTVSDEVKDGFLKIYPECKDRTEVFHNILDIRGIVEKSQMTGGYTDYFSGIRILTVGRLTSQKSFEVSVEAMKLLKEKGVNARWYILGEGDERSKLTELIAKWELTGDFLLLGSVENPYPYYRQADLYVHATRFEGKSIAIQEAKILGCPILVSDCSGNREQVEHGVDGLLCEFTPEAICQGVCRLIENEEERKAFGVMASSRMRNLTNETDKILQLL